MKIKSKFNAVSFNKTLMDGKWFMSINAKNELMKLVADAEPLTGEQHFTVDEEVKTVDNLAVILIDGILYKGASDEAEELFGLCNTDKIYSQLEDIENDDSILGVLLICNSPGGEVTGIEELARKIHEVNQAKPVFAWTETESCSASYWLMAQARLIGMTYSAEVGSVGVYTMIEDITESLKKNGITMKLFSAGEHKLMRSGLKELTKEETNLIQFQVDELFEQFKSDITKNRNIEQNDMNGLTYLGREALEKNYVDMLCDNLDEFIEEILDNEQQ